MNREVCIENKYVDLYLGTLLSVEYGDLSEKTRDFIFYMYNHLKSCDSCREDYVAIKRNIVSDTFYTGLYPPDSFGLLKRNEDYLKSLARG